jgi:hypothetical protein
LCIRATIKRIFAGKRIKKVAGSKNSSNELINAYRRIESRRYSVI